MNDDIFGLEGARQYVRGSVGHATTDRVLTNIQAAQALALISIAESLEKLANPPTVGQAS